MKKIILITILSFISQILISQTINQFDLSILFFQNVLTRKLTKLDIEKLLNPYKAVISDEQKTLSYNANTNKHDIPNWELHYSFTYKKVNIEIEINYSINDSTPIKSIGVYLPKNSNIFNEKFELNKNSYKFIEKSVDISFYDSNKFTTSVFYNNDGFKSIQTYFKK